MLRAIILGLSSYVPMVSRVFAACLWSHPCVSLKSTAHNLSLTTQHNPQHSATKRLFSPLTSLLLSTTVVKRWDSLRPSYPGIIRIYPESPVISSFESSLLGGRTLGRQPYCKKCVTPQRVQRSTGVINTDIARGYVLVSSGTFNLII
jgi:hypothetical protein